MTEEGGKFGGLMEKQSTTLQGNGLTLAIALTRCLTNSARSRKEYLVLV